MSGQGKSVTVDCSILAFIGARARCLFDDGKPFTMWFNGSILGVSVLADAVLAGVVLEIIGFIGTWTGSVVFHIVFLDDIDCFAMK